MLTSVLQWVKQCDTCARCRSEHCNPPGLLQPLSIPAQAWQDITMDFVEGLPKSCGKNVVLVVVCKLTKYGHFIALKHPYSAATFARLFIDNVARLHELS